MTLGKMKHRTGVSGVPQSTRASTDRKPPVHNEECLVKKSLMAFAIQFSLESKFLKR